VVGHDLGAVTAYYFAAANPERVNRLVFIEAALPTSDMSTWPTLWHWPLLTRNDLAEALIAGNEHTFVRALIHDYARRTLNLGQDIEHYAQHLAAPGGLRSALAWFREGVSDDRSWLRAHSPARLTMPVLALGGGLWGDRPLHMLREVADDVRGGTVPGVGHWIPEEAPAELAARLRAFYAETPLRFAAGAPVS
jgi:pimeloyl-ACP methyl ester carboxylesterase